MARRNCSGRRAKAAMPGQDADRRHGDVAGADAEAVGRIEDGERGVDRRPVEQRLAHAHEDDVGRQVGRVAEHDLPDLAGDLERATGSAGIPSGPVAQKAHLRAHPAWEEMQRVRRPPRRDQHRSRSPRRRPGARGTSGCRRRTAARPRPRAGGGGTPASSSARSVSGSSVASAQDATGACQSRRTIWPAR